MDGRKLRDTLAGDQPGLKTLYMSGYTASVITDRGVLEEGVNFIQKPFTRRDLVAKVREALD
jgi:FixJ family two-component response regulator